MHWSRFRLPFTAVAFSTLSFTVLYVVFPLQVERVLGFDRHHTAYLFVLIGLVSAAVQGGLIGRLVPRFGERALIVTGGLLLAAGLALLPTAFAVSAGPGRHFGALLAGLVVIAAGSALVGPSAATYVSRVAPSEEQGRALGMLQSVGAMARIGGPLTAGVVAGHLGPNTAFLVASGAAGLAGLSAAVGGRSRK
jgi:MFS family permease